VLERETLLYVASDPDLEPRSRRTCASDDRV